MTDRLEKFETYRHQMNDRIAEIDHIGIKRFFNLDTRAYTDGALSEKTKELLGLVASMVLRCNDCKNFMTPLMLVWWLAAVLSSPICATQSKHLICTDPGQSPIKPQQDR